MATSKRDEWVDRLARLFREHPAWVAAAHHLSSGASSTVYFAHHLDRDGHEPWRLEQCDAGTCLLPGAARDPDFIFRFSPESIEQLEAVDGTVGDFAVALFSLVVDDEVQLRIAAGFPRLIRRGYVKLLLVAGPPVVAFGATHGIRTLGALRRLVAGLRRRGPADWEA
jgi:hypothetical protein